MKSTINLFFFKNGYLSIIFCLLFFISPIDLTAKESVKMLSEKQQHKTQKQMQNPHWRIDGCQACHKEKPKNLNRKNIKLHTTDINQLCNSCHTSVSKHSYIHPFGMKPSKKIIKNMPRSFSIAVKRCGGKLTCITFHDLNEV